MDRINKLFQTRGGNILSIYFTAGFPVIDATAGIIKDLAMSGVDMIEIGMPFSDPLADGPVIQKSSEVALNNGMTINLLFHQLANIRREVTLPLILMGYINPVLKFGMENFCRKCAETGIDGVILPDLPPEIYLEQYSGLFEKHDLQNILLISPQSDNERIKMIDSISRGFIYMVSSSSTTGIKAGFSEDQKSYFKRIKEMDLTNPSLIGFGISDSKTFAESCRMAHGAIIGSAFVKMLGSNGASAESIMKFVYRIRGNIPTK
jgi:tryptophan synthase alpha chain